MQELEEKLKEVKDLHQKVLRRPAPELEPQSYFPFPPGVDPIRHALLEAQQLAAFAEQTAFAPRPHAWVPRADTFATKDEFIVRLEIPGVSREDLKVFVVGGECVVRGERKPLQRGDTSRPIAQERPWGEFERRFVVPVGCRLEKLKARVADGELELRIPLAPIEVQKEREVEVS